MDALYKLLDRAPSLSLFDTALLVVVFLLAKQRYDGLIEDLKCARQRIIRLERALLAHGFELGDIEEE